MDSITPSTAPQASFLNVGQYVAKVTWTKGIDPKTGKPVDYDRNQGFAVVCRAAPLS
jgi:alcohol dehydrogenase (cytochrome c)